MGKKKEKPMSCDEVCEMLDDCANVQEHEEAVVQAEVPVNNEEYAELPMIANPDINDQVWQAFIGQAVTNLDNKIRDIMAGQIISGTPHEWALVHAEIKQVIESAPMAVVGGYTNTLRIQRMIAQAKLEEMQRNMTPTALGSSSGHQDLMKSIFRNQ